MHNSSSVGRIDVSLLSNTCKCMECRVVFLSGHSWRLLVMHSLVQCLLCSKMIRDALKLSQRGKLKTQQIDVHSGAETVKSLSWARDSASKIMEPLTFGQQLQNVITMTLHRKQQQNFVTISFLLFIFCLAFIKTLFYQHDVRALSEAFFFCFTVTKYARALSSSFDMTRQTKCASGYARTICWWKGVFRSYVMLIKRYNYLVLLAFTPDTKRAAVFPTDLPHPSKVDRLATYHLPKKAKQGLF